MKVLVEKIFLLAILGLMGIGIVQAQDNTCPELVEDALSAVDEMCENLGRNQVCYGNNRLEAIFATDTAFEKPGDIAALEDVETLTLSGMDIESSVWGIALLAMQANLPDTSPGQKVTFVMFGDVTMESAVEDLDAEDTEFTAPMQAFYFTSGIGEVGCAEAPQSGLLVQTPEGVGEVMFTTNGVEVGLGSTAFLQAEPGGDMIVSVVEGQATLTAFGVSVTVPAGALSRIQLDEDGFAVAAPEDIQPYDLEDLNALPIVLLDREIEIASPLDLTDEVTDSNTTDDDTEDTSDTTDADEGDVVESQSSETSSSGGIQVSVDGGTSLSECSGAGEPLYTFYVENQSDHLLLLYWIDWDCESVLYQTIQPGASTEQGTYPTHPWKLVDNVTGETLLDSWGSDSTFTITVSNE